MGTDNGNGQGGAGTLTLDQVKGMITESLKPISDVLATLTPQVKTLIENDSARVIEGSGAKGKEGDAAKGKGAKGTAAENESPALTPDAVTKLIADALKARDDSASAAQANQAAAEKFLLAKAPKLKGNGLLMRLLTGEKDDAGRDKVLAEFSGALEAGSGQKPNLLASAESEGGTKQDPTDAKAAKLKQIAEFKRNVL